MGNWTLSDTRDGEAARLAGYAVHDALGVRLGYVGGWVKDPQGQVRMLKVAVTEWDGSSEYLVPVGAVTLISDTKSMVQLRDVTKHSIGRLCYRYKGQLPEPRLLSTLQRHFRAPRPSVVERLAREPIPGASSVESPAWKRLAEMDLPDLRRDT